MLVTSHHQLATSWIHQTKQQKNTDEELDALGVDLDVLEMTVANPDSEEFTYDYL